MPKSRIILCLGFFIALLPVLGFPNSWDHFFDTASGLLIVLLSVLISVDRRLTLKAKAEKRAQRKRVVAVPAPEEPAAIPELEPETVSMPVFSEPEPAMEVAPVPTSVSPEPVQAFEIPEIVPVKPKRRRKMKVVDADASAETTVIQDAFDTHNTTEF